MASRAPSLPLSIDPLIAEAKRRARRRWLVITVGVALLAGGAAALALRSSGPSAASAPQGVLGSSVTAALGQRSVHWSERIWADMVGSWRVSADLTANAGVERLTIPGLAYGGRPTSGTLEIRLVAGVAYVQGNPKGLEWLLFLTHAQASRYAGRWISIPSADRLYAHVSGDLTLGSVVHAVTAPDAVTGLKTTVTRKTSHGTPVIVFQEGDHASVDYRRLSMRASGDRLPLSVYAVTGLAEGFRGNFSKWNEPVRVTAPAQAVSIAAVRGS